MPQDSAQACVAAFIDAMVRRDMDAALGLLSEDVVFFYSNGASIIGKQAFATLMTANWKMVEDYRYTTVDSSWVAQSDAAASVIYSFEWSGTVRGEGVRGSGRGTRVLTHDGAAWRIAHEHLSTGEWRPSP
jgi:ketosteroid isomerase-like protein